MNCYYRGKAADGIKIMSLEKLEHPHQKTLDMIKAARLNFNYKEANGELTAEDVAEMNELDKTFVELSRRVPNSEVIGSPPGAPDYREPKRPGNYGKQSKVFESDNHAKAFVYLLKASSGDTQAANKYESLMGQSISNVHTSEDNTRGGYLVPETLSRSIIDIIRQYGAFRRNASLVQLSHGSINIPKVESGVEMYFVAENAPAPTSVAEFKALRLDLKKLCGLAVMSNELSEDAIVPIGDRLAAQFARDIAKKEDEIGFFGDASGAHGGIIGVCTRLAESAADGNDVRVQAANWGAFDIGDLVTVMSKTVGSADDNSAWFCSKAFFAGVLLRLAVAAGGTTLSEMQNRVRPYILGYPVHFSDAFPRATAGGQTSCLFGDLSMACLMGVNRNGIEISKSDSATIGGQNLFERNQQAIRMVSRWDANAHAYGQDGSPSPVAILGTT